MSFVLISCYFCPPRLPVHTHIQPASLTWKSELGPCSRAGLSGATGLRLLQKWMPDSSGLWASSRPVGV